MAWFHRWMCLTHAH